MSLSQSVHSTAEWLRLPETILNAFLLRQLKRTCSQANCHYIDMKNVVRTATQLPQQMKRQR